MLLSYLDTIALFAAAFSVYLVIRIRAGILPPFVKTLLALFAVLNALRHLGAGLVGWGMTDAVSRFAGYFEVMVPIVWVTAIFAYTQAIREKELSLERTNFQAFFDAISDLAFILNSKMEIMHVNPAAQSRLGYPRSSLVGKHIRELMARDITITLPKDAPNILITGESHLDCALRTQNDVVIPVEMKLSQGSWNGMDAIFCVSRDVTERRAMESRLRQTEKMDIIGQMAGGIAHDFNNQLLGIMGYADVLLHALRKSPKERVFAENLMTSAKHAAEITKRLLSFARQNDTAQESVDLHALVDETVVMLSHSIDKRIHIHKDLKASFQTTAGDRTQLQSVILNVALNGRDAMTDGGDLTFTTDVVTLDKKRCRTLHCDVKPGRYLELCIRDSGAGMSRDTISRIFEPFFTTKEKGRGTGMGMVTVYNTMKHHHGSIDVRSEEGKGTSVSLFFPISTARTDGAAPDKGHSLRDGTHEACRVLLVDDEDVVRQVAAELLKDIGCTVSACNNGREAVEYYLVHQSEIDLIILDMVMPEMNGEEAFTKIREINPSAKVIGTSGHAMDDVTQTLMARGLNGFLVKPYRQAELSEKLRTVLSNCKSGG